MRIKLFEDFDFSEIPKNMQDKFLGDSENDGVTLSPFTKSELSWFRRTGIIDRNQFKSYIDLNVNKRNIPGFYAGVVNGPDHIKIYKMYSKSKDEYVYYMKDSRSRFYYKSDEFEEVKNCPLLK